MRAIKAGDILVASWGLSTIFVDFYLVVGRTPKMVTLHRAQTQVVDTRYDPPFYDFVLPNPEILQDEEFTKKVRVNERTGSEEVRLHRWSGSPIARLWNGDRERQTCAHRIFGDH